MAEAALEKMKSWFDRIGQCEMEHSNDGVVSLEARPAPPQHGAESGDLRHAYTTTPRNLTIPFSTRRKVHRFRCAIALWC